MSITVSQDLLRSQGTSAVQYGRSVRPAGNATDSPAPATLQGDGIRTSGAVMAMLEAETAQRTVYDEPGQRQQRALSAYEDVLQQDKKDQLQQMFAIDLYA